MATNLQVNTKSVALPTFFPDATRGVIRAIDNEDLRNAGIEGIIVNTYHLLTRPGAIVLKALGGIKGLSGWDGFTISDSGGFQLLSMVYRDASFGTISDRGVVFHQKGKGSNRKYNFTPEKCIQTQFAIGADILICLDDCPPLSANAATIIRSVDRTIAWAKRCQAEYLVQVQQRKLTKANQPLLFAVVQGGNDRAERQRCAEALVALGFDGYGYGGWPLDEQGAIDLPMLSYTASLLPSDKPKYALGVGNPQAIVDCYKVGWTIFDCVLPTRDARHQRLYNLVPELTAQNVLTLAPVYEFLHIHKDVYIRDDRPIDASCDCHTCQNYSRAYLNHLYKIGDSLAGRLGTIHNLRTYTRLIAMLRQATV